MKRRLSAKVLLTAVDVAKMLGLDGYKQVFELLKTSSHYKKGGHWFPMPMIDENAKKEKNKLVWLFSQIELYQNMQDGKTKKEKLDR